MNYNTLPSDPVMLLSFINTQLRDSYSSLEDLCNAFGADITEITTKLELIDYTYHADSNQFLSCS